MQLALPCLLYAPEVSKLILKGGTNAEMAPPIEYMTDVSHCFNFGLNRIGKFQCNVIVQLTPFFWFKGLSGNRFEYKLILCEVEGF